MSIKNWFNKRKSEVIDISSLENKSIKEKEEKIVSFNSDKAVCEEVKHDDSSLLLTSLMTKAATLKGNFDSINHEYYICKIFSRVALSGEDFKAQIIELDNYNNSLLRMQTEIERLISYYKKAYSEQMISNETDYTERVRIYDKEEELNIGQKVFKQRLLDINNTYYGHLKISTVSVCMNKNNEELETFYKSISEFLQNYRGMSDAAEDIYYKSGDFLSSLIKELIRCIHSTANQDYIKKFDYAYFLNSDVIITIDVKEWIELYNKVKFAFKLIQDIEVDQYLRMKEKNNHFETIYTILMMRYEVANSQGRSI